MNHTKMPVIYFPYDVINDVFTQAIVGDKYGYRPIPSIIEQRVFESMTSVMTSSTDAASSDDVDMTLLQEAYRKDENAQPPVYVLQRISSLVPEYNSPVSANIIASKKNEFVDFNSVFHDYCS